jgi:hypothetical protein
VGKLGKVSQDLGVLERSSIEQTFVGTKNI